MKGVVFTEFLEMVGARFSEAMVETLIAGSDLPSGGAYTSIGTYEHQELVTLVVGLSERTQLPVPALIHAFGRHLLQRFIVGFPQFFSSASDAFTFLDRVEGYVHIEVRKLYPDAELPSFECTRPDPDTMLMLYRSRRGLADLASGLIEACAEHYGEQIAIEVEDRSGGARTEVCFHLRRTRAA